MCVYPIFKTRTEKSYILIEVIIIYTTFRMVGKDKFTIADHPKIAFPFTRYGAILLMDENCQGHAFERKSFSYILIELE